MTRTSPVSRRCEVFVDARCLQDPNYSFRGVGFHVSALLRARSASQLRDARLVGMLDPSLPSLPGEYASLFDELMFCWNPVLPASGSIFISASPMTHDPTQSIRFTAHPRLLSAAVVYDFIPMDRAGYFPQIRHKIDYVSQLARLKSTSCFMPISHYSAKRLREVLGVSKGDICVTGACVRQSLYQAAQVVAKSSRISAARRGTPYVLSVGGGDRRKNTEVVVNAVRKLNERGRDIKVKVVGHYGPDYIADLMRAAAIPDGSCLEFCPGVSDEELVRLYAGAVATVAPSHIEGFSLPVVEAAVCGAPVIASMCAAHLELVRHRDALFGSEDSETLANRISAIADNPELRSEIVASQAHLPAEFHESKVGERFWQFLEGRWRALSHAASVSVSFGARPNLAIVSPYPPQASGVARFTEMTIQEAGKVFDLHLYTDAERPLPGRPHAFTDSGLISDFLLRRGQHDAVLNVLGNSHFHDPNFRLLERFGGPTIIHDSRYTQYFYGRLGRPAFLEFAARLLGRPVTDEETDEWLHDRDPATLFVEPMIERARPLIVHTREYQLLLQERYGYHAELTTFPPNIVLSEEELSPEFRRQARARLGIDDKEFAIISLGYVSPNKGLTGCLMAMELLKNWSIPAKLYFAGSTTLFTNAWDYADIYGVRDMVHFHDSYIHASVYRDYLVAADAGIQMRTYGFGQPSAGLGDCIGCGIPAVANESLARACDAPSYVSRIPDVFSSLQVAEALATFYESGPRRTDTAEERAAFLSKHSFTWYVEKLKEILNL